MRRRDPRVLQAFAALEDARAPFAALAQEIVGTVAAQVIDEAGRLVEIGSGDGQLRRWLPEALQVRLLHTEPLAAAAGRLQARHPDAVIQRAHATALPIASESVSGVLGLCVLDEVTDLEAARQEFRRVLVRGGRLVHFLDLATNLEPLFIRLTDDGEIPLPNFVDELPPSPEAPSPGPFDDLLIAPRHQVAFIVSALRAAGHPFARPLGAYVARFSPDGFDPKEARHAYVSTMSDPRRAAELKNALAALFTTVKKALYRREMPLDLRLFSTLGEVRRRLLAALAQGFALESDEVVTLRGSRGKGSARFEGRWAGWTVTADVVPPQQRGRPLRAPTDPAGTVVECGVHVLVARRL